MVSRSSRHAVAADRMHRHLRVGEELRHALADLLQRGRFRDPELSALNVTITEVRLSPDLRNAVAFIAPFNHGDREPVLAALRRAAPHLRGELARAVRLKYAPTLSFQPDESFDYAERIDAVLRRPEVAKDLSGTTETGRTTGGTGVDDMDAAGAPQRQDEGAER